MALKQPVLMVVLSFLVSTAASADPLAPCTITMDGACPDVAGGKCGAEFSGGNSCLFAALPNCYDSGTRSYEVTDAAPVTITFPNGELTSLEVFFSGQDAAIGQMVFFDSLVGGNQVDAPLSTNGSCPSVMPPRQTLEFTAPVKRIEVTAMGGTAWIDTFMVNPISTCGDGVVDFGEACDDGNGDPDDMCDNSCMIGNVVPAVSEWGVVIMAGVLLTVGSITFRRARPQPVA